jgi:type IV pilus assembly protein PilF
MGRTLLALAAVLSVAAVPRAAETPSAGGAENTFNLGLSHLREGRPEQAVEAFRKAIKEDPKNPYFYKGLGQGLLSLKKYSDAVGAFRKALELNPYYTDLHNDLGTALAASGKIDEGRKEFMAALADPMNPTPELTTRNIGQAYFDQKNYLEAANWFRSSVSRNKKYGDAYLRLADTLALMGNLDEAVLQLEAAAKELPDDLNVSVGLAEGYYRAGRFSDARTRLEAVAGKDPTGVAGRRAATLLKNFPH